MKDSMKTVIIALSFIAGLCSKKSMADDLIFTKRLSEQCEFQLIRHDKEFNGSNYFYRYDFVLTSTQGGKEIVHTRTVEDLSGRFPAAIDMKAVSLAGPVLTIVFNQQGKCYAKVLLPLNGECVTIAPLLLPGKSSIVGTGPLGVSCETASVEAELSRISVKLVTGDVVRKFILKKVDDGVLWVDQ